MTKESKPFLYTRSDGFTETPEGDIAVVMLRRTKCNDEICWLRYRMHFTGPAMTVEWGVDDNIVLLPMDVATGLLSRSYARLPTDKELAAFVKSDKGVQMAEAAEAVAEAAGENQEPDPEPEPEKKEPEPAPTPDAKKAAPAAEKPAPATKAPAAPKSAPSKPAAPTGATPPPKK